MPSTNTITSFYSFTPGGYIYSAEVNNNFNNFRGHILPIDPNTATAAETRTYDLGSNDYMWRSSYVGYSVMYGNTAGSVPANPTATNYAIYFKNDGSLYKKNSAGVEVAFLTGSQNVASTTGGFTLTNVNDVVLANISASSSTYNLFTAVGNDGKVLKLKKIDDTTTVTTINANSTETIDGALTNLLSYKNDSVDIISDGSNWQILNSRKAPTVQKFTTGSGTYTTPNGVKYLKIKMVGGGGGGSGSGTAAGTAATAGGNTTFGSSFLTCNGGGAAGYATIGTGGSATIGTGAVGTSISGSYGGGLGYMNTTGPQFPGGYGAATPLAGPSYGSAGSAGGAGASNTGCGGGGGGTSNTALSYSGAGGGAGGYIDAIVFNPSSSYAYAVGSGGNAGGAGTSGFAGGAGGSGYIEVIEFYS